MRFSAALISLFVIASSAPVPELEAPPVRMSGAVESAVVSPKPATPSQPLEAVRAVNREISGITFEGVAFDSRSHRLVVADQAGGPGSQFRDAASACSSGGGLAAVNAGFFTPEGKPLGLVVSSGKTAGAWNSASSLGSGIWHEDSSGRSAISRRERLGRTGAMTMHELIQAGPMLVENNRLVVGLDPLKSSVRTVILWDGGSRWWLGRTSACPLNDLGKAIVAANPAGWPVKHALNLDGGRSSDLWISSEVPGGPLTRRSPWNREVRNFLILTQR